MFKLTDNKENGIIIDTIDCYANTYLPKELEKKLKGS